MFNFKGNKGTGKTDLIKCISRTSAKIRNKSTIVEYEEQGNGLYFDYTYLRFPDLYDLESLDETVRMNVWSLSNPTLPKIEDFLTKSIVSID